MMNPALKDMLCLKGVSHFNIQLLFDGVFSGSQPEQIPKRGFD
jgi:hypothetical protein